MRRQVHDDIRDIFNAPDRHEADRRLAACVDKYRKTAPRLAEWMENNIPEGLTVFVLPPAHRRYMRTTNMLERLNEEIKRRTRVAGLFPNEAALLRLVAAILMETDQEWQTAKKYMNMNVENVDPASNKNHIYRKILA